MVDYDKIILEIICYSGTGFTLLSYCFRTIKLRMFLIIGNILNIVWAFLEKQFPILVSNILYIIINIFGLVKELNVNEIKKKFRSLDPKFKNGQFHCLGFSAPTEKKLIAILKKEKKL